MIPKFKELSCTIQLIDGVPSIVYETTSRDFIPFLKDGNGWNGKHTDKTTIMYRKCDSNLYPVGSKVVATISSDGVLQSIEPDSNVTVTLDQPLDNVKTGRNPEAYTYPETYCVREWLNEQGSDYTGSVVAYDGMIKYHRESDEDIRHCFLEIADCHCKVRLHSAKSSMPGIDDFTVKLRKLHKVIGDFIDHLTPPESIEQESVETYSIIPGCMCTRCTNII